MSLADITLAKFMRSNVAVNENHLSRPAQSDNLASQLAAFSPSPLQPQRSVPIKEQTTPPPKNGSRIVLKSGPTRDMCLMLQSGDEANFDKFLKFYLPENGADTLLNR